MKRKLITVFALLFAALMVFTACSPGNDPHNPDNPGSNTGSGEEVLDVDVTIYFKRSAGYTKSDAWIWDDIGAIRAGGYLWTIGDYGNGYGAKVTVSLTTASGRVGFIIRTDCTDPGGDVWGDAVKNGTGDDRFIPLDPRFIKDGKLDVYIHDNDKNIYILNDQGQEEIMKVFDLADMTDLTHINCIMTPAVADLLTLHPKIADSEGNPVVFTKTVLTQLALAEPLDLNKTYTVTLDGYGEAPVIPYSYFSTKEFGDQFNYEGDDLGVTFENGVPSFRLWAPTASKVVLKIYSKGSGDNLVDTVDMEKDVKGTWKHTGKADYMNKYYTYTVTTATGTQETVDPYAVSGGVNGARGMIIDLSASENFPKGWNGEKFTPKMVNGELVVNYTDAELWEVHVRDFSKQISGSKYQGKYLAFTETGLKENGVPVGIDYLKELGITHVHLQPVFDYSSVDETTCDGFNWGYDPQNYNMPEGSYSTDPSDGAKRVVEFRAMVQALHDAGIGVVMDVVYNHTSGINTNFQKIVPYYYYRYNTNTGKPSNGSGCGNETASDRAMFRKFIVESVTHWMKDYNVDGFRFDLMALHDVTTMREVAAAVHKINPQALIYGEGWDAGSNGISQQAQQARLENLSAVNSTLGENGIAMFNDTTRDGAKGGTNDRSTGFITSGSGNGNYLLFAYTGGTNSSFKKGFTASNPTQIINYLSCHDNLTFFDKIQLATTDTIRQLQYNRLGAALVQTSLGVPFMLAGEEMLRSKPNPKAGSGTGFDENSYSSSDEVNNLKWNLLTTSSNQYQMMQYYKGLIAFRAAHPVLRSVDASVYKDGKVSGSCITVHLSNGTDDVYVVLNCGGAAASVTLPTLSAGTWNLYVNGTASGTAALQSNLSGVQSVPAYTSFVYAKA